MVNPKSQESGGSAESGEIEYFDFTFDWHEKLEEENEQIEKLSVEDYKISRTGKLTIYFNRPFLLDPIIAAQVSPRERRDLSEFNIGISDFISVKVNDVEDDDLNRQISHIYLEQVNS